MDSRWRVLIVAGLVVLGVAVGSWFLSREPAPPVVGGDLSEEKFRAAEELVRARRYTEAFKELDGLLSTHPDRPDLNYLAGICLYHLRKQERALPHLETAARDEAYRDVCRYLVGKILARIDRPDRALPLLEVPLKGETSAADEADRIVTLAECHMDLEQFARALDLLEGQPMRPSILRLRVKALSYLGREEDAEALLAGMEETAKENVPLRGEIAYLRAAMKREAGDFEGAAAVFEAILADVGSDPGGQAFIRRARLALLLEWGKLEELERAAAVVAAGSRGKWHGDGLWYQAVAQLATGRAAEARATAETYLEDIDRDYTPLRLETLMMRFLAGDADEEELKKEAGRISRFRSNLVYFFLALATGDKAWAEKAKEVTPGRNFPYHSIQRLLEK